MSSRSSAGDGLFSGAPDSLVATRFAALLSDELAIHVPLRTVFDSRNVEELIEALRNQPQSSREADSLSVDPSNATRRRQRRLSFSQERMAFMQALSVGSAAYHVVFGLRLSGAIDRRAMARAVDSLPRRFEVLRTRFLPTPDGIEPVEVDGKPLPLRIFERKGDALRIATEFSNAPFDLESGDTARAALIVETDKSALLVLAFHHIVVDQWSYELLLEELSQAYAATLSGRARDLPAAVPGLPDYALWHRAWFRTEAFDSHRAYWVGRLAGAERVSFDPDWTRPAVPSYRGARLRLAIPEDAWTRLERLALANRSSLSMVLFATLSLLLRNHAGSDDVVIGLPIANRNHGTSLKCFGTLVNTLPIRVGVQGQSSFTDHLLEVRKQFLDAFEHQDLPFEALIGQLRLERSASLSPLFGVMLNVLNTPPANMAMPGLAVERVEIDRCGAQFDLTLTVDRLHTRSIWFEYAVDLYSAKTIELIMARFESILGAAAANPDSALDKLPHRAHAEAGRMAHWKRGPQALPADISVQALVFAAATTRLEQPAVQGGPRVLTYGELHRRASALASGLQKLFPEGRDFRVGLLVGRTSDLPVAMLGSLLAGVTFVPLDSAMPDDRLAFIAGDAQLNLILTDAGGVPGGNWLPPGVTLRTIEEFVLAGDAGVRTPLLPRDHAAYILYTSGTTGYPKGVQVPERALANFLNSMSARPGINSSDRLLAVTTLSFDISLLELLLPLTVGARVIIADREQARDGHALAELIRANEVTMMQGTPSTWYQLLEAGWKGSPTLRALVGGEPLPRDLVQRLLPVVGELWNMYGPTETTVWSSCSRIVDAAEDITVGTPIDGTTIEILDTRGRSAGIGIRGEVAIGGAGLATGYFGRPELTRERFRELELDGSLVRYYRTGDIGWWTPVGHLRIQGRTDRQVKLRGHRIEPGEIESCVQKIAGVRRALVTTHAASSQDVRLALYVIPHDPDSIDLADIRLHLKSWLPEYMIPQVIVVIDGLPELPNGKVDFRRLAEFPFNQSHEERLAPPQSHEEEVILSLWKELLGIEKISRDQDFFALGGHSLLAMRLVNRIREELQRRCTLAQVLQNPTIASLCAVLTEAAPMTSRTLVALQPDGAGTALFCICGLQLYRPLIAHLKLDAQVFATYVPMVEAPDIVALAREYAITIRAQQPRGPYRLLGFSLGGVLAFEIAQLLRTEGDSVEQLVILDSDVPGEERGFSFGGAFNLVRRMLGSIRSAVGGLPDYLQAIRAYRPRPYPGKVVFVEAMGADRFDPGYTWSHLAPDLSLIRVESDHLELMSEGIAAKWAPELRRMLVDPED